MAFLGFVNHERIQLFAGICLFGIKDPNFVMLTLLLADAPAKGTILTLTTQTVSISNGENCSIDNSLYSVARP